MTIRGAAFATGATISVGGRAATDVAVRGADILPRRRPVSTIAGPVDIVVTLNGRTAALTGGFRYEPTGPNTAPVIRSIAAQGKRLRQPPSFADYGETIQVTVVVEDAESTAAQLAYQWQQCCGGIFNGTGPQVEWTAPADGDTAVNVHHPGHGDGRAARGDEVDRSPIAQLRCGSRSTRDGVSERVCRTR